MHTLSFDLLLLFRRQEIDTHFRVFNKLYLKMDNARVLWLLPSNPAPLPLGPNHRLRFNGGTEKHLQLRQGRTILSGLTILSQLATSFKQICWKKDA